MTLSRKYNDIMDKVVVTDEMRRRILGEISSADAERLAAYKIDPDEDLMNAFSGRKRFPVSKILAGLAVACAIILIAGVIRITLPVMSPSTGTDTAYEEAAEFSAEEAEADTMVGMKDTGSQPEMQGGGNANAKAEAEDNGAVSASAAETGDAPAEGITSDRAETQVRLGEPEIRKVVENYIGSEYVISDTATKEDALIYTVSDVQTGKVFSYIRIYMSDGSVEIENAETGEISMLTFRDLTEE
jgi:hypothetical protein